MTLRHRTTSNRRLNNILYVNGEIYNVEQRRINVFCFYVHIKNVRQRRNNALIFNVEFHNAAQRRNNVVNLNICKKLKNKPRVMKYIWSPNKNHLKLNTLNSKFWLLFQNLFQFIPHINRATKLYLTHYSCVVIIFYISLYKSAFLPINLGKYFFVLLCFLCFLLCKVNKIYIIIIFISDIGPYMSLQHKSLIRTQFWHILVKKHAY